MTTARSCKDLQRPRERGTRKSPKGSQIVRVRRTSVRVTDGKSEEGRRGGQPNRKTNPRREGSGKGGPGRGGKAT